MLTASWRLMLPWQQNEVKKYNIHNWEEHTPIALWPRAHYYKYYGAKHIITSIKNALAMYYNVAACEPVACMGRGHT